MPRQLTESDVAFRVEILPEDTPVRGNAIASGDDELDRQVEDEILARLDACDLWAWCVVRVIASFGPLEADAVLGGCSYCDEAGFTEPGGYFDDMKKEALADLQRQVERTRPTHSLK